MQALFWMLQREKGVTAATDNPVEKEETLWEKHPFTDGTCFYFCPMFRLTMLENPNDMYHMCGGIIADEMGLGKTITMLSLLLVNRGREGELIAVKKSGSEMVKKSGNEMVKKSGNEMVKSEGSEMVMKSGSEMMKSGSKMMKSGSKMVKCEGSEMMKSEGSEKEQTTPSKPKRRKNKPWEKEENTELMPSLSLPKRFTGGTLIICPLSLLFTALPSHHPHS